MPRIKNMVFLALGFVLSFSVTPHPVLADNHAVSVETLHCGQNFACSIDGEALNKMANSCAANVLRYPYPSPFDSAYFDSNRCATSAPSDTPKGLRPVAVECCVKQNQGICSLVCQTLIY